MWKTISENVKDKDVFGEFDPDQIDTYQIGKIVDAGPAQFNRAIQSIDKLAKVFNAKKDKSFNAARRFYLNCLGSFYGKKY